MGCTICYLTNFLLKHGKLARFLNQGQRAALAGRRGAGLPKRTASCLLPPAQHRTLPPFQRAQQPQQADRTADSGQPTTASHLSIAQRWARVGDGAESTWLLKRNHKPSAGHRSPALSTSLSRCSSSTARRIWGPRSLEQKDHSEVIDATKTLQAPAGINPPPPSLHGTLRQGFSTPLL